MSKNANTTPNRANTNNYDNDDGNYNGDNDNENVFDNPYDENGFPRSDNIKKDFTKEDELNEIKKRLKKDFTSKLKTSTMK